MWWCHGTVNPTSSFHRMSQGWMALSDATWLVAPQANQVVNKYLGHQNPSDTMVIYFQLGEKEAKQVIWRGWFLLLLVAIWRSGAEKPIMDVASEQPSQKRHFSPHLDDTLSRDIRKDVKAAKPENRWRRHSRRNIRMCVCLWNVALRSTTSYTLPHAKWVKRGRAGRDDKPGHSLAQNRPICWNVLRYFLAICLKMFQRVSANKKLLLFYCALPWKGSITHNSII